MSDQLPLRHFLLKEVLQFVQSASRIDEVQRIALIGSLTRDKEIPKDADVS